jgi:hypothetical protein
VTIMRTQLINFLTLTLCLTLTGAAQACLCHRSHAAVPAAGHPCCKSDSAPAPTRERCSDCQLLVATVPDRASAIPTADFAPAFTLNISDDLPPAPLARFAVDPIASGSDLPPLLRDLHHLFSQLTE